MFFLVPYNLIDRDDLSIIQKMCILYLARHFDEKGALDPINELELAEKLRVSTSEIRLNLDVLLSKGIINIDNQLINQENEDKDAKDIIVKEAVFKNLSTDSFEELKMKLNNQMNVISTEASVSERSGEVSPKQSQPESSSHIDPSYIAELASDEAFKEETRDPDYEEFVAKINSAEEKIKERAAKLKLNVRRRDRRSEDSSDKPKYNRRKTDRIKPIETEKREEDKNPNETDELLKILAESNKTLLNEKKSLIDENFEKFQNRPNRRKQDVHSKRKNINSKFYRAKSVYTKHDPKNLPKEEEKKDDIEV